MPRVFALLATLSLTSSAFAGISWTGDVETGNTSQWSGVQVKAPDRVLVVDTPVRQGKYSLRFMVKQGDSVTGSGNRSELTYQTNEAPGSEYYYKWSTFFPSTFPRVNSWQIFAQWHHTGCCGSPPVEFFVVGDTMFLRTGGEKGTIQWSAPLKRATWNDFIFRVKWSSDPKVGFVELWHNGEHVLTKTAAQTQFPGERNYLKIGLYRDAAIAQDGVLFHDDFTMASTLADVLPPLPVPNPNPVPTPTLPQVEVAGGAGSSPSVQPAGGIIDESPATEVATPTLSDVPAAAAAVGSIGCSSTPDTAFWLTALVMAAFLGKKSLTRAAVRVRAVRRHRNN